jgi:hypothetical protein
VRPVTLALLNLKQPIVRLNFKINNTYRRGAIKRLFVLVVFPHKIG